MHLGADRAAVIAHQLSLGCAVASDISQWDISYFAQRVIQHKAQPRKVKIYGKIAHFAVVAAIGLAASAPTAAVKIISRAEWSAHPALANRSPPIKTGTFKEETVVAENRMLPREAAMYLMVHHTGTQTHLDKPTTKKIRDLQGLVQGGYWIGKKHIFLGDVPYHYYVSAQGDVAEGRELKFTAYSNTINKTSIATHITVVLEGNFDNETPTQEQLTALSDLLLDLAKKHKIKADNIRYHQQVAETSCPGKNLIALMPQIIQGLKQRGLS